MFASVHLQAGDSEPSIDPDRYTLFAFRFCPFCDRVRYTLNYHKVDYDTVLIKLSSKPEWFTRISPSGKVPMLLHQGEKLVDSDMIMRFVDQLQGPDSSLIQVCGDDMFTEACSMISKISAPMHRIMFDETFANEVVLEFKEVCSSVESRFKGNYFAGDSLSLADILLFPLLDRLEIVLGQIEKKDPEQVCEISSLTEAPQAASWPKLVAYLTRMRQLPFISSSRVPTTLLSRFSLSYRQQKPDPEIK